MPKRKAGRMSKMMTALYGASYAERAVQRLEDLDPEFNRIGQEVAYDFFWSRKGLGIRDKSLITVAALVAMGKEEQTRAHMRGFLHVGGTAAELRNALIHLALYCGFPAAMNGFVALKAVLKEIKSEKTTERPLSKGSVE